MKYFLVLLFLFLLSCSLDKDSAYWNKDSIKKNIEKSSKKLSATLEMLSLYIDLNKRRVAEFEVEKVKLMDDFINLNKSNFKNDDLVIIGKLKK